jgi:tetratricopeptide (TPR) repeat protein
MRLGNFLDALYYLNKSLEIKPNYTKARFNRGLHYLNLEKFNEAILDFNIVINENFNLKDSYLYRGLAFYSLNKKNEACSDWMKSKGLGKKESEEFLKIYCN